PFVYYTDTATPDTTTLSLHDALPIFPPKKAKIVTMPPENTVAMVSLLKRINKAVRNAAIAPTQHAKQKAINSMPGQNDRSVKSKDRKSTRLNSSHVKISYAVFCLKKK